LFNGVDRVVTAALGAAHTTHARPLGQPAVFVIHVQTVIALHTIHKTSHSARHLSSRQNYKTKQNRKKKNVVIELLFKIL